MRQLLMKINATDSLITGCCVGTRRSFHENWFYKFARGRSTESDDGHCPQVAIAGHEIVFIGVPDVEPFANAAGLKFVSFCENEYPAGSIAKLCAPISNMDGLEVMRWSVRERLAGLFTAASKHLPKK